MTLDEIKTGEDVLEYLRNAEDSDKAMEDVGPIIASNSALRDAILAFGDDVQERPSQEDVGGEGDQTERPAPALPPADDGTIETEGPVRYRPEWLGTYGKNRALPDALKEMRAGLDAKDRHIEYLSREKVGTLESELQKVIAEREELRAKMEMLSAQKPEAAPQAEETGLEPPPAIVPPPPMPEGSELFDEDAMKKWRDEMTAWQAETATRQEAAIKYATELSKKVAEESARRVVGDLGTTIEDMKNREQAERARVEQQNRVRSEYDAIGGFMKDHPDVFGGVDRPVSQIEADNIKFMSDLAEAAGITGGIYSVVNGQVTNKLRPDVLRLVNRYNEGEEKVVEVATQRGIVPPAAEEVDALYKVYRLRTLARQLSPQKPLSMKQAYAIALSEDDPMFRKREVVEPPPRELTREEEQALARQKIAEAKSGVAKEIVPGSGGSAQRRTPTGSEWQRVAEKKEAFWTDEDRAIMQAASDQMPQAKLWDIFMSLRPASVR